MKSGSKQEREECAIDALIVSALRQQDSADIDPKGLPELTKEEQAAVNALSDEFVARLWEQQATDCASNVRDEVEAPGSETFDLACTTSGPTYGLDRAQQIDAETADELERQKQAILNRKAREQEATGA